MRIAFCGVGATGKSTLARWIVENQEALGLEGQHELNPVGSRSTAAAMGFEKPYDVDKADLDVYTRAIIAASGISTAIGGPEVASDLLTQAALRIGSIKPPDVMLAARGALFAWKKSPPPNANLLLWGRSVRPVFQLKLQADKIAWELEHDAFVTDRTTIDDLAYAILHCRELVDEAFYDRALKHMKRYDAVFYCQLSAGQWLDGDAARQGDATYYRILDVLMHGLKHEAPLGPRWRRLAEPTLSVRQEAIRQAVAEHAYLRTKQP